MAAYYNEFDKPTAAWLRELIRRGLIAPGDVDERSIKEVQPDDLRGYEQVHFFAGIGGWSYALRLAGVADDFAVWTGSCPCQPFSAAGKRKGVADDRHLWPDMLRLIAECRPAIVFGEQVPSAIGHGWLDGVFADLEGQGYARAAIVLGSHSVGAPNIRQRLWWLAESASAGPGASGSQVEESESGRSESRREGGRVVGGVGNSCGKGFQERVGERGIQCKAGCAHQGEAAELRGDSGRLGNTNGEPCELDARELPAPQTGISSPRVEYGDHAQRFADASDGMVRPWEQSAIVQCRDGKARRFEPGSFPLAHGVPARVVRLRGYGNAINPWVAKEFIAAYFEAKEELGQCAE